ncbi:MAG: tetratricopeptide repeat protein, partial [Planctomycetaceae bacterium]
QQLTSFVGRGKVVADLKRLLFEARLLMLLGPGGAGKTRLSIQVATEVLNEFPGGVWWIELAPLADPALVGQTVAAVLGIREAGGRPVVETLVDELRHRQLLLIFDNCEHLVGACAVLANTLLRKCPGLRILASSRERLGIDGELHYRVPSLTLPAPGQTVTAAEAREFEAVALFCDRARAATSKFALTDANADTVVSICRRLDGIPLALELAAARTRALSVEELERRLDNCFKILTGGNRSALPRQQTLRALIDWSYDMLKPPEKKLLSRLSVFAGGFEYDAAEQVCTDAEVEEFEILDLLTSLVDKSLVVADTERELTRYSLLETVRQYARDRLEESGESAIYRQRHLDALRRFAADAADAIEGKGAARCADRYEIEHDNIRAAIDFAQSSPETAGKALELANNTWVFWYQRGYYRELAARMPAILAATEHMGQTESRATGLLASANAHLMRGDYEQACRQFEESLRIQRDLGAPLPVWRALFNYGNALNLVGKLTEARSCLEEALRMSATIPKTEAGSHINLGETLALMGDFAGARAHLHEALGRYQESGNNSAIAEIEGFLGRMCQQEGGLDEAEVHYRRALELLRTDRFVGFGYFVGPYCFAQLALARRDFGRAARLFGAHAMMRERLGTPLPPVIRAECAEAEATLRAELGVPQFQAEWKWGRA